MTTVTKTIAFTLAIAAAFAAVTFFMFSFTQNVEAHSDDAKAVGSKLELSITDGGRVIVRGAEVTEISGDVIRARTEWGATAFTWNIDTSGDTDFVTKSGSGSELADIEVGQVVSFSGVIDQNASAFTVDADVVKNWSLSGDSDAKTRAELRTEVRAEAKNGWGKFMSSLKGFNWFGHNNR